MFGRIGAWAPFHLALEAERFGTEPVVLAVDSLVLAATALVHGTTSAPDRVPYRTAEEGN